MHSSVKTILLLCLVLLLGCTATNQVRTIGKGKFGIEATLGGPVTTSLGPPVPMPNIFLGGRYGILQDLDVAVHYNIFAPIIPGIPLDLITGVYWVPIQPGVRSQQSSPNKGWAAGGSLSLQWLTDFKNGFMLMPALELAGGWRYKWVNPYLGLSCGLNFYRPEDTRNFTQLNPFVGTEFFIRDRASIALKCTMFDIAYNLYGSQIKWVYMVDNTAENKKYGVLGVSLGFSFKLGHSK